jgi:hypothetical protein
MTFLILRNSSLCHRQQRIYEVAADFFLKVPNTTVSICRNTTDLLTKKVEEMHI